MTSLGKRAKPESHAPFPHPCSIPLRSYYTQDLSKHLAIRMFRLQIILKSTYSWCTVPFNIMLGWITAPKYILPQLIPNLLEMILLSTLINKLATASKQPVNFDNCGILCVPFSVISWLASNTFHASKIPIHPTLYHLTVTEDTLQSRKHCHCKAGHRGTRGTKNQMSVGGCLALGAPTGPEAAGPSQLPTDSQYQGEGNSGRSCSSIYPKAIY